MPFSQDLTGLIEPTAKTWQDATPEQRTWYYGQMAKLAERKKRVELMQAIGRGPGGQSVVMAPRKHPRSDGATGPVMDPHGGASRAFQLLASSATASSCKLYWRAGGAVVSKSGTVYFTDILGFHADGLVRGAPVRDVRLSDDSIKALRQEGESIWRKRPKQSGATTPKTSATQPTKLSTKGPTQQGGNPFKTILPPKTPKQPKASQAKAEAEAKKAAEAARVAEAARRKAEAEARAAADRARLEAAAEAARKKAEAEAKARAEAAAKAAAELAAKKAAAKALAEAKAAELAKKAAADAARAKALAEQEAAHKARLASLAAAKAKADAEAKAKAGATSAPGGITLDEVRARLAALPADAKPSQKNIALYDLVASRLGPATPATVHGMTDPESFHAFRFDGINYHFTFPAPGAPMPEPGELPPILAQLRSLASPGEMPPKLAKYTTDVYLSSQRNKDDAYWEKKYNSPGFRSEATGGDGVVVGYNGGTVTGGTLYHEAGHNLANGLYGSTRPPDGSPFGRAIASGEHAVSDYARNSPDEDFAEAVKYYVSSPAYMKEEHPLRYEAIRELIGD